MGKGPVRILPWVILLLAPAVRAAEPHWAFRAPNRPEVPAVQRSEWARNPIDAFVAAEHERRGLIARPGAPKHVLLRRVHLDLIGLPPTRDELHAFLADTSPDAYEKVVDRLLASPRYGERWGRHWMDVWRYSDWAGYQAEVRESQPFVWRWRDWIVESLNADKPYDRMVREMLAGDEIAPTDPRVLRATGFLARNWYKFNRNVWLENTVEHTGKAFLGLTLNCARCHDHKYDPVSQVEHYRFRAFFEPYEVRTDRVPGEPDTKKDGIVRAFDADGAKKTFLFLRGDEKSPLETEPLAPGVPAALCALGPEVAISPVNLPTPAYYQGLESWVRAEVQSAATKAVSDAEKAVADADAKAAAAQKQLDSGSSPDAFTAARSALAKAQAGAVLARLQLAAARAERVAIDARLKGDDVKYTLPPRPDAAALAAAAGTAERQAAVWRLEAAVLAAEQSTQTDEQKKALAESKKKLEEARAKAKEPATDYTPLTPVNPSSSTGRRLALAKWITDPKNPLAARVAVNHIWSRHFGEGLVPTVFDFGKNGKPPTNGALLDWLAVEMRDGGWSMKRLHRLIVTSATYRMDSGEGEGAEHNRAADPDNRYLWHAPVRRMEAELVRDSVLQVAGKLDLTMGGPELDPSAGLTTARRSLYYRHAHEKQMTFLQLFDAASPNECYRRQHSVVPQQALALANSPLALTQARALASQFKDEKDFVGAAFEAVLSRLPAPGERAACDAFLQEQSARLAHPAKLSAFTSGDKPAVAPSPDPAQRARENLVHVLINHNDFVTIR
jgi:hypothetical protein